MMKFSKQNYHKLHQQVKNKYKHMELYNQFNKNKNYNHLTKITKIKFNRNLIKIISRNNNNQQHNKYNRFNNQLILLIQKQNKYKNNNKHNQRHIKLSMKYYNLNYNNYKKKLNKCR